MDSWFLPFVLIFLLGTEKKISQGQMIDVVERRSLYRKQIDQLEIDKNYCVAADKLLNIAILMDTSMSTNGGVAGGNHQDLFNTVDYAFHLTRAFELDADKTRVALARYVNKTEVISNFNEGTSHSALQQIFRQQLPRVSGNRFNTAEALTYAAEKIFTSQNGVVDNGATKILVLITFTRVQSDLLFINARNKVENSDLVVYVAAVGEARLSRDLLMSLVIQGFTDYIEFAVSTEMASSNSMNMALIDYHGGCDQCIPNPCVNGTCMSPKRFQCKCDVGFQGLTCNRTDYCIQANPCHGETCHNPVDKIIVCTCTKPGRYGEFCQFVDHCEAVPNACLNGGTCQTNRSVPVTTCMCATGYYGNRCEHEDPCVLTNYCLNQGACSHDINSHQTSCTCVFPFNGAKCSNCTCQNGGICTLAVASGRCQCPTNCNGSLCENCLPYCTINPGVCQNGATCNSTGLTYKCLCPANCVGRHCETCSGGTCNMPRTPCPLGHICQDLPSGGFVCACPQGCSGPNCQQCSYCATRPSPCLNGGTCVDRPPNTFGCMCKPNYSGPLCEVYVYCESNPQACRNGGTCQNLNNDFTCQCQPHCSGRTCDTCLLPCDRDASLCKNGAVCENIPISLRYPQGGFVCLCTNGCSGTTCEHCNSSCTGVVCQHGGNCISPGFGPSYCNCTQLCYGERCERCLPYCVIHPLICANGGTCQNLPGGHYACQCTEQCTGQNCDVCPCQSYPCYNGGTCITTQGTNPRCQCTSDYTGQNCESAGSNNPRNPCLPNPCLNGCLCTESCRHSGGYVCKGSLGFIGKNCEISPPSLDCLPQSITVRVPEGFAKVKARSGNSRMEMFVGSLDSVNPAPGCSATQSINGDYRITMNLPTGCANVKRQRSGSTDAVSGEVWMNLLPNGLQGYSLDMPVPIASFECVYGGDLTFVTSLRPVLAEMPTISEEIRFKPQVSLCKTSACPTTCPSGLSINREAVYTVGEIIHVMISSKRLGSFDNRAAMHATISRLRISCEEFPSPNTPGLEVVSGGCTSTRPDVSNVKFSLGRSGIDDVICLSFKAMRLGVCKSRFFLHADLRMCAAKDLLPCPRGSQVQRCVRSRKRRRSDSPSEPVIIGPFYVFDARTTISMLNYTDHEEHEVDLIDESPESSPEHDYSIMSPDIMKYAVIALFIFVTAAASVCVVFFVRRSSVASSSYRIS